MGNTQGLGGMFGKLRVSYNHQLFDGQPRNFTGDISMYSSVYRDISL